jgi:hypothetical protein
VKLSYSEEIEIPSHVATWLFAVRSATWLVPTNIPEEAKELELVDGSFPDYTLSDKGAKLAMELHSRSTSLVAALDAVGVHAMPHPEGVTLSFEDAHALIEELRAQERLR